MIPFDDTPAARVAMVRARLQTMNGGGKQPPPDYPPVTYAPDDAQTESVLRLRAANARIPTQYVGPLYKPGTRPSYADDIDRIVQTMIAEGDVRLSPSGDYVGTRGAHWRWRYADNNGQ
jgi:hypothetical protein